MAGGQLKIVFTLFALGILAASLMASFYFYENIKKAEEEVLLEIEQLKVEPPPLPDPGADRFEEARELLLVGEHEAARSKLLHILKFYDDSSRYQNAKEIIGEMNLDRLLSSEPTAGKVDYTVRGGDSLVLIANRNQSTLSYIMRANNMVSTRIHPGDRLMVSPLVFTVIVNVGDKTLTLTREDQFFKEYAIKKIRLPHGVSSAFSTTVTDKIAFLGSRRIPLSDSRFQEADKWLHTKVPGFVFGAFVEAPGLEGEAADGENLAVGVSLAPADFEELFTLIRLGTKVKVVR